MVADSFLCLKIGRLKAAVRRESHPWSNNWFSIFGRFCYDLASNSPTVAIRAKIGRPLAFRCCHSAICQGTLPGMPQRADFGGFYYDRSSDLLAYHAVTAAICQRSPQTLRELPTLANGLDAES
jgi:hypothetical protein